MKKGTDMRIEPQIAGISHSAVSMMAGSSHTLSCCLSKLRSSLEAGKKQLRVWLEYVCSADEVFLYSSFGAPLVLLWPPFDNSSFLNKEVQREFVCYLSSGILFYSIIDRLILKDLTNKVKMSRKNSMKTRSDTFRVEFLQMPSKFAPLHHSAIQLFLTEDTRCDY